MLNKDKWEKMKNDTILETIKLKQYFPIQTGVIKKNREYIKAVNGVSISLQKEHTLGLVGESGCGKTTLGRSILRLYEPTEGDIILYKNNKRLSILELSVKEMRKIRSDMQMIFQDPFSSLNERMTVQNNIIEPLVGNKIGTSRERKDRAEEIIEQVGLKKEHLKRYPHSFSGGQRQRIGIARALSVRPKIIIADEPVSALDVSVQGQILNLLKELQEKMLLTYLFISHDIGVIRYMSDRIAIMYVGKIVEVASRDEIIQNPAHPYTEALLSAVPIARATRNVHRIMLEGDPPNPAQIPAGCIFHTRCRYKQEICMVSEPEARLIADHHFVACHLSEQMNLLGITQNKRQ